MWRASSASQAKTSKPRIRFIWGILALLLIGTGCSGAAAPTQLPTLTLIPATATHTPTPLTPTPTRPVLPGPGDLVTASPTPVSETFIIPQEAIMPVERALADLAGRLEIEVNVIDVIRVEAAVWSGADLGCSAATPISPPASEIMGFRVVLSAHGAMYEYHTNRRTSVRLCPANVHAAGRSEALLLETDPVAAQLIALAQRRLAAELDLPEARIRIVSVTPYTWIDSSLGCPDPGQTYRPVMIEGYRIEATAGDRVYIFHTDSERLNPCAPGRERLPE